MFIFELFLAAVHAIIWSSAGNFGESWGLGGGVGVPLPGPTSFMASELGGGEITGGIKMCKL